MNPRITTVANCRPVTYKGGNLPETTRTFGINFSARKGYPVGKDK